MVGLVGCDILAGLQRTPPHWVQLDIAGGRHATRAVNDRRLAVRLSSIMAPSSFGRASARSFQYVCGDFPILRLHVHTPTVSGMCQFVSESSSKHHHHRPATKMFETPTVTEFELATSAARLPPMPSAATLKAKLKGAFNRTSVGVKGAATSVLRSSSRESVGQSSSSKPGEQTAPASGNEPSSVKTRADGKKVRKRKCACLTLRRRRRRRRPSYSPSTLCALLH